MKTEATRNALLVAAIIAGASYYIAVLNDFDGAAVTAWKGAGVALLALWAASQPPSRDRWWLFAYLALGALGDVLIETSGLRTGGLAFMAGHIVAIVLFLRNRRARRSATQTSLAVSFLVLVPAIAFAMSPSGGQAFGHAAYGLALGAMAAAAWVSRFSRYRVGVGAVLFVVSDLLIFARGGPLAGSIVPTLLVWPLYFAGQLLIAWGVVTRPGERETRLS